MEIMRSKTGVKGNERNEGRDIPIEVRINKERTKGMTLYEVLPHSVIVKCG
jgi:hypothetical protein